MSNEDNKRNMDTNTLSHKDTVLIVDDSVINQTILKKILISKYNVIIAENGKKALEVLQEYKKDISAVMLDLIMPVMDGYEFLEFISGVEDYKNIPVIVTTGNSDRKNETRALSLGAWDFVSKPYEPEIISFRLKNAIDRSQITAFEQLKYLAQYDTLTGIYNKNKFFNETHLMLKMHHDVKFVFLRFDVDRFALVNSFYGTEQGDNLLKYIAKMLREYAPKRKFFTYGRIEADQFAFCTEYNGVEYVYEFVDDFKHKLNEFELSFDLVPSFGIYEITNHDMPISEMLDFANLATKKIKNSYVLNYAFYSEDMSRKLVAEQEIINDMNNALKEEQFVVYLQPKYDLHTNTPAGAEALVRWIHPQKGMISPGMFIPVFESNGFISKLDYYMWDKVCALLRKWMDNGIPLFPISVNVSRVNLYNPKLVDDLCNLVKKYNIPSSLFNLELTESAYTDNPQVIKDTMKRLHENGFIVLMDDFGSGYSSLNILKDIDVDVLKIDMQFFSESEIPGRGENIISSVVRMAKWLNMPCIAEGVEKSEQVDFLRGIRCEYVQGYYFARPMPVDEYETLIREKKMFEAKRSENFDTDSFWNTNSQLEMLFSNMTQAVGIYEFENDKVDILRVNKAYYDLFGYEDVAIVTGDPMKAVSDEDYETVLDTFRNAIKFAGSAECNYRCICTDKSKKWIHVSMKYINKIDDKSVIMCSLVDITSQKEIDLELQRYKNALSTHSISANKIMIVDDIEVNRALLIEIFGDKFEVITAANGKEALELLKNEENYVDLILLDLIMPEMTGQEFLKLKNADARISTIPVIIITSDDSAEQQIKTLSLGADDYIVRPFVKEIVLRRVQNVLESHRIMRDVLKEYSNVVAMAQTDSLTKLYNRSSAKEIVTSLLSTSANRTHAMVLIDVDKFKGINSTFGFNYGDEVMKTIAAYIKNFFRKDDVVSRFASDEFCITMVAVESADIVVKKCVELCKNISSLKIGMRKLSVSVSIGIAITGENVKDFPKLYENADIALYKAKEKGGNCVEIFGKETKAPFDTHWINKEWLVDALDEAIFIFDYVTFDVLYVSNAGMKLCSCQDYSDKKCYELLHDRRTPCPFCINKKLTYDSYYQWSTKSNFLDKNVILRDKLVDYNGVKAHLQIAQDITDHINNVILE